MPLADGRGFAVAEVLQINELFVDAGDLSLQLVELLANRCELLRVCGLGGCRFRLFLGVADNEDGAIRAGEVFVGPDFFWFLRLGRRNGVLRGGQRRRGAALLRLRGSEGGREKRQDHCE